MKAEVEGVDFTPKEVEATANIESSTKELKGLVERLDDEGVVSAEDFAEIYSQAGMYLTELRKYPSVEKALAHVNGRYGVGNNGPWVVIKNKLDQGEVVTDDDVDKAVKAYKMLISHIENLIAPGMMFDDITCFGDLLIQLEAEGVGSFTRIYEELVYPISGLRNENPEAEELFNETGRQHGNLWSDINRKITESGPGAVTAGELQAAIDMYRSMEEPLKLLAKKKWVARTRKLVDSVVR